MEHVDVLIVGAGISGIGAACHLQTHCPGRSFVILEGRQSIGGTWDLFRYPGIRSDSDMYTLGFSFKPWLEQKAIADGPSIMRYLHETVEEHQLGAHIRFSQWVSDASWSSKEARWTVAVTRKDTS
jgi:cation diffusion facilitator CzcD-associated flavoprotein CzcO